eukprot:TRINITY_DN10273_c2_g1_i1.p1 TRINITY_DN10273_c2_g1~~TRINITY_DN10273_c2_g1_i1.p1  ORF type:complete len:114 (+),score=27.96 TRINITY_DN10273_c2_g1_i1:54-344(+)
MLRRVARRAVPAASHPRRFASLKVGSEEPLDKIVKNEVVPGLVKLEVGSTLSCKLMMAFSIVGMMGCWTTVFEAIYDAYSDPNYGMEDDEDEDEDE